MTLWFFSPGWHPNPWPLLDTSLPWRCTQSTSTSSPSRGAPNLELYSRAEPSCTEPAQSCFHSSTLKSSTWCTEEHHIWTQRDQSQCRVFTDLRLNWKQIKACKKSVFVSSFHVCLPVEKGTVAILNCDLTTEDFLQYASALLKMSLS